MRFFLVHPILAARGSDFLEQCFHPSAPAVAIDRGGGLLFLKYVFFPVSFS